MKTRYLKEFDNVGSFESIRVHSYLSETATSFFNDILRWGKYSPTKLEKKK